MASSLQKLCAMTGGHEPSNGDPSKCRTCSRELHPETGWPVVVPLSLRAAVGQVLVIRAGFADFWSPEGPADHARAFLESLRGKAAAEVLDVVGVHDAAHVLAAFDAWDGSGGELLRPLLEQLSPELRADLARMSRALNVGPAALSAWLSAAEGHHE